jgi:ABC-type phosphate transport system substrate-binding protein
VTVSKTEDLVNQTITVSWQGFRPSSSSRLQNAGDSLDINTEYPVRVYECRGADPESSSDCYGSPGFRGLPASGDTPAVDPVAAFTYPGQTDPYAATPDGPANWQDNVTSADGTGQVSIQVFTKRESAGLGCDASSPCSIVVVPNYGRGSRDLGDTEDLMDAPWAWERRAVVPLSFLPVDNACPLGRPGLAVEGSPMAASALASWRARTCRLSSHPVQLDYTSIGEPQTRGDVGSGTAPTGLVIDPLDADAADQAGVVYAPIAVTSLVVAFQVDDAHGKPVSSMKLDPRLVAKLITASYRSGGDPAVIHNRPYNLFSDPEFLQLNPDVDWPSGAPGNHVLILGDLSDTTTALTRWIAADKDARDFLAGKPDPWGMTVNDNYKDVALPFASFPLLDSLLSNSFAPVQELDALARQLSIAQFPGGLVQQEGGVNVTVKQPRQNPGSREVIGIIDAASADRFQLSTAALENASGSYVTPTVASMTAAINDAKVNPDGVTRQVDLQSKDPDAYPLTLQISAALSTTAEEDDRQLMADFLSYAGGEGQVGGDQVGQLPGGYAPLTKEQTKQLESARQAVLTGAAPSDDPGDGDGDDPSTDPSDAPSGGPGGSLGVPQGSAPEPAGTGDSPSDSSSDSPDGDPVDAGPDMVTVSSTPIGARQLLLPALGLVAALALLGGPAVLWAGRTGRGPRWLRR